MLQTYFRPFCQQFFIDPIVRIISKSTVFLPIVLTLFSGVLGVLIIPALLFDKTMVALILLFSSGLLDILDGSVARERSLASPKGAVLDIFTDRVVEASVVMGLYLQAPGARGFLCLLMLISILLCITSFLVVAVFVPQDTEKSFHYSPGLMERAEAFLFFALMIICSHYFSLLASVFVCLVLFTALYRVYEFLKNNGAA